MTLSSVSVVSDVKSDRTLHRNVFSVERMGSPVHFRAFSSAWRQFQRLQLRGENAWVESPIYIYGQHIYDPKKGCLE